MPKPNKIKKIDYDQQLSYKQYELSKQILICDQMLQDKKPDKEIKATCEAIGKLCKEMLKILEKKHGTNHLETMYEKNKKDGDIYRNFLNFSKCLFAKCLSNNQLNKKKLEELLKQSVSHLKENNFFVIFAKELPDLKSEKPKNFKNKQEYVDYIKGKIKIYGAGKEITTKKAKLYDLLGQWYSALYELDYYVTRTLERRKNDWGILTTGLSLLNWYCNSNIHTKVLLFMGGAMAPYISDCYHYLFHGNNNQERELLKPSAHVKMFHDHTVDAAIDYLQKEIGKFQQQLSSAKSHGLTSEILNAVSRGCGSLLTDKFSANMSSSFTLFSNSNVVVSQTYVIYMVSKMLKGFTMQNNM
ncbi:MAG: hypothetical protein PVG30_03145 [Gammaproteobacteria bacterium]|jgi:hypothetical protein